MAGATSLKLADLELVGPGTPAGRYFRLFWQPVMRARDLRPGTPQPIQVRQNSRRDDPLVGLYSGRPGPVAQLRKRA